MRRTNLPFLATSILGIAVFASWRKSSPPSPEASPLRTLSSQAYSVSSSPALSRQRAVNLAFLQRADHCLTTLQETTQEGPLRAQISDKLGDILIAWAADDLNGVSRWLAQNEEKLPRRSWNNHILKALSLTNPRKAYEFGISIISNYSDRSLPLPPFWEFVSHPLMLDIALKELTAHDAVRLLDLTESLVESVEANTQQVYHPDFDFQLLAKYMIARTHSPDEEWDPPLIPGRFVHSWTLQDRDAAAHYCQAMNDRSISDLPGQEYLEHFEALSSIQAPETLAPYISAILVDPSLTIDATGFVFSLSMVSGRNTLLTQIAPRLPDHTRNQIASETLMRYSFLSGEEFIPYQTNLMRLFTNQADLDSTIQTLSRREPKYTSHFLQARDLALPTLIITN